MLVSANLAVRLLCELGLLSCPGRVGIPRWLRDCPQAPARPGGAAGGRGELGLWVAPASRRRLAGPARLAVEVLLSAAGVKGRERQVPLWALMLATVWLDIVFAPLLAAGVETIETVPGTSGGYGKAIIHAD